MDYKGRKFALSVGSLVFLICGIFSSFMTNFYTFIFFRIGVGVGIGFIISTIQTFITEISNLEHRGHNSIIIWLGFPLGELYMCWIASIFPLDDITFHEANWKIIMVLAAIPICLNFIILLQIKESPRYHLIKNNFIEAFQILDELRVNVNLEKFDEKTKKEIKINFMLKPESSESESIFQKLINQNYFDISLSLWVLWFCVNYIFYGVLYLIPEIISKNKQVNNGQKLSLKFFDLINAVVLSTFYEVMGIFATFIIEIKSIGRVGAFRISFMFCFLVCVFSLFSSVERYTNLLELLKGFVQIAARALYPYTTEIYPTELRGTGLGMANVFARAAGIITPLTNEILLSYSSFSCFVAFLVASGIGLKVAYRQEKETLGVNIE